MIAATVHCDEFECKAWAFCGADGLGDPEVVEHGEFDSRRGWIDGTYALPEGWQRTELLSRAQHRCPAHAVKVDGG